jgi:hypothetical protein
MIFLHWNYILKAARGGGGGAAGEPEILHTPV